MSDRSASPDSVRLALPGEASAIAAVQRRSWGQTLPAEVAASVLASVDLATMAASWEAAIVRPPLAELRVLVALGEGRVVGFSALGPSDEPDAKGGQDALVAEFVIDPQAQRRGHGSRLLNAVADTLRTDGFVRATWWVRTVDDVTRRFLTEAGWEADGAHQEVGLDDAASKIRMIRLHTGL